MIKSCNIEHADIRQSHRFRSKAQFSPRTAFHTRKDMKFRHLPNLSRLAYRVTWLNSNAHASHVLSVVFPDHS